GFPDGCGAPSECGGAILRADVGGEYAKEGNQGTKLPHAYTRAMRCEAGRRHATFWWMQHGHILVHVADRQHRPTPRIRVNIKYYILREDMSLQRRRFAYPTQASFEKLPILSVSSGTPFMGSAPLRTKVAYPGIEVDVDMILTIPIVRRSIADLLRALAGADVECIDVVVENEGEVFTAINVLPMLDCVDEERSGIEFATADNPSPGGGKYRTLWNIHVLPTAAGDAQMFRIKDWPSTIVVSDTVRRAMQEHEVSGIVFKDA
ncbi:MAG: hypothetical protein M3Z05_21305, partial [Gemmatimonadota bacterium]|nr:hypothetical protein [Gemmatimonadota bacterium]